MRIHHPKCILQTMRNIIHKVESTLWKYMWPQHCERCHGFGEDWSGEDWCPHCTEQDICPRCGQKHSEEYWYDNDTCIACGWQVGGWTEDKTMADPLCITVGPPSCICHWY